MLIRFLNEGISKGPNCMLGPETCCVQVKWAILTEIIAGLKQWLDPRLWSCDGHEWVSGYTWLGVGHSKTVRSFHELLVFHGMHVVPEPLLWRKVINPIDSNEGQGASPRVLSLQDNLNADSAIQLCTIWSQPPNGQA